MIEYPHRYRTNFNLKWGRSSSSMKKYKRAAIVPFFVDNDELYYIFAIDSRTGELSDFGGKRSERERNWFDTALREFNEESYYSFNLKKSKIKSSNVVFDGYCVYTFVKLDIDMTSFERKRRNIVKYYNTFISTYMFNQLETSDIVAIKQQDIEKLLKHGTYKDKNIWMYIRHFFSNGQHWPKHKDILNNYKFTHECEGDGSSKYNMLEFSDNEW